MLPSIKVFFFFYISAALCSLFFPHSLISATSPYPVAAFSCFSNLFSLTHPLLSVSAFKGLRWITAFTKMAAIHFVCILHRTLASLWSMLRLDSDGEEGWRMNYSSKCPPVTLYFCWHCKQGWICSDEQNMCQYKKKQPLCLCTL